MLFGLRKWKQPFLYLHAEGDGGGGGGGDGDNNELGWRAGLPEDLQTNETLAQFKPETDEDLIPMPKTLAKSYVHARSLVGADTYKVPKTDEEWDQTYNQLGRPESKDLYILQTPKDINPHLQEKVKEDAEWFREEAHKLGFNDKQASTLFSGLISRMSDQFTTMDKATRDEMINTETQMRVEYGQTYDAKEAIGDRALVELGGENFAKIWKEMGLEKFPEFKRLKFKMGELVAEDLGLDKTTGQLLMSKESLKDEANKIMAQPEYIDPTKPGHKEAVAKVRKIYEQMHGTKPVSDVIDKRSIASA